MLLDLLLLRGAAFLCVFGVVLPLSPLPPLPLRTVALFETKLNNVKN